MLRRDPAPLPSTIAFYCGAILISWTCWLLAVAADHGLLHLQAGTELSLVIVGGFGPLFSAVAIVARASGLRGAGRLLGQALHWRVSLRWYIVALLVPAALRFAVLGVHILKGGTLPDLANTARWLALPVTFLSVLVLGGPLGEEFGWRGVMQPHLQTRFGILSTSMIVGGASALWHLPLFLIPSTPQSHLPFALFLVRTIAISIVLGWLWNRSNRNLLLVLLFHASLNTWPNTLFILEAQGTLGPYISTTIFYVGSACILVLAGQMSDRWPAVKPRLKEARTAA